MFVRQILVSCMQSTTLSPVLKHLDEVKLQTYVYKDQTSDRCLPRVAAVLTICYVLEAIQSSLTRMREKGSMAKTTMTVSSILIRICVALFIAASTACTSNLVLAFP